ncbi:MAG: FAD-dependent oxidoreductase [Clostridia bacterium]|nr:FAD-dependent oxidoreductase [Clostridia bacterium]
MILVSNINLPLDTDFNNLKSVVSFKGVNIKSAVLYKKSVDARRKNDVHFCCSVLIEVDNEKNALKRIKNSKIYTEPIYTYKKAVSKTRPVVVGFGPAGIFAAYTLAKAGLRPIVIERGDDVDTRKQKVDAFWSGGKLDTESNVQFGEGGAGTFSDGKLTTGISDIRCREVLKIFHKNGADKAILTDAKAHIGTDVLAVVVKNIRNEIISLGGEVRFCERLEKINLSQDKVSSIDVKKQNGEVYTLHCDKVILAIGHSARDTFYMLNSVGINMIKKPFAVGFRIEHKQEDINKALYGDFANHPALSAASYKLAVHLENDRGVYTFCMCPGGYVVNASSEEGKIAVNGMSYFDRSGENANSAVLTEVLPEDLGADLLSGIEFQRKAEEAAYNLTNGKGVPVQTVGSFVNGNDCKPTVSPTIKPHAIFTDLSKIYPEFINNSLRLGISALDKKLGGFADSGAVLTGPETRSSSPLRIVRNEDLISISADGLYPAGEGAGYAGGIMSAAVDGIKCAESLINSL